MEYRVRSAIVGSSLPQTATYLLAAVGLTVGMILAVRAASITGGLLLFAISLVAAGLQAKTNGGLLPSWLLGLSIPVGFWWALSGWLEVPRSSPINVGNLVVFGLFFGTLFYVVGIEGTRYLEDEEPRQRSQVERYVTLGLLAVFAVLFGAGGLWRLFVPTGLLN